MSTADKIRHEGHQEGLRLGMRAGAASTVKVLMKSRFGPLPRSTLDILDTTTLDELERIARALPTAVTVDQVPLGELPRGASEGWLAAPVHTAKARYFEPSCHERESLAAMFDRITEGFRAEGREEGRVQGRHDGAVSLLRAVLEQRFAPLPVLAVVCLQRSSMAQLERAAQLALSAPTLDAVFAS